MKASACDTAAANRGDRSLPRRDRSRTPRCQRTTARGILCNGEPLFVSTTLRAFNVSTGLWELVSAERGNGHQDTGTARKVGTEMHIEQRFGTARWRIRYYDIGPDRFSWTVDVSIDEGATWQRGYLRMFMIGPIRDGGTP